MAPLLSSNASISCLHGGRVLVKPGQQKVIVEGAPLLCEPDLLGSAIAGCPVPVSPSSKPCTLVAMVLPGSSTPRLLCGGRPVYLATLQGMTDGVPPAPLLVQHPGQARVRTRV